MKDEVKIAREQRKLSKRQRKALARTRSGVESAVLTPKAKTPIEPPLWLRSSSMDPVTTPMFPTQVPIRPTVMYTDKAWAKIQHMIHNNTLEIGWWGTVRKDGNTYTIEDVFVPKQVVSGGTTEISGDGLNKVVDDLLVQQGHADNLLYWGHLHPTFSCTPSHTDEKTTQGFVDNTDPGSFFIRGIYNKKGESKVDIYQKDVVSPSSPHLNSGWIFQNVLNTRIPAVLSPDELVQFKETCKANVEEYVPVVKRTPIASGGTYSKIIEDPASPGLYKMREGTAPLVHATESPYPEATQGVLDDLDDGVITLDDLELLQDPYGVRGEGYGTTN